MRASCDEKYLIQMGFFSCTRGMKISHSGENVSPRWDVSTHINSKTNLVAFLEDVSRISKLFG